MRCPNGKVFLDFLLDSSNFVLDLGVFLFDVAVFLLTDLILEAGVGRDGIEGGSLVPGLLLYGDRSQESWRHLGVRKKVLQRLPIEIVGHAEAKRHGRYKLQSRR